MPVEILTPAHAYFGRSRQNLADDDFEAEALLMALSHR